MQKPKNLIQARDLHKYVWMLLGVFFLLVVTFPIACIRVSQEKKFAPFHFHLKSLTLEYKPHKLSGQSSSVPPKSTPQNKPSQSSKVGEPDHTLQKDR